MAGVETGFGLPNESGGGGGRSVFTPSQSPFADNAARDAWALANLADVRNSDTEFTRITVNGNIQEWGGTDAPTSTQYNAERASAWSIMTNLTAGQVSQLDALAALPMGAIPSRGASGLEASGNQVMSGGETLFNSDARFESTGPEIGQLAQLEESNSVVGVRNAQFDSAGRIFEFVDARSSTGAPSLNPRVFVRSEAEGDGNNGNAGPATPNVPLVLQPDESSTLTTNPLIFGYTVPFTARTNDLRIRTAGPMTNVRVRVSYADGNQATIRFLPSEAAWDSGTNGYNWTAGDNTIEIDNLAFLQQTGDNLQVEVRADSINMLGSVPSGGNVGGFPYLAGLVQRGDFVELPYARDTIKDITEAGGTITVTLHDDTTRQFSVGGSPLALDVSVDDSDFDDIPVSVPNSQEGFAQLNNAFGRIQTLENTAFSSGRAFVRFNDGFTIDRNNIAQFEDRNIIYTAKNDKPFDSSTRPDVNLPNDTEIQAAGETYPVVFEFTHLGGSGVFQDRNVVRFFLGGMELQRILREQVAIVIKPAAGEDYQFQTGGFDPNNSILPNGVFNLKRDTPIDNIANITAELSALTIVAGDAYLVGIGGSWSGLTVPDGSVLVALVNNPSTVDSPTNDDWLLLDNPRVNAKSAALLANFDQDGIEFNASRNINVNPSNVNEFNSMATGTPLTRQLLTNTQGFDRLIRFDNAPIQLSDIVGGALDMLISIDTVSSSGFELEPLSLELGYPGGISFMFPLNSVQLDAGQFRLSINIPNIDYSAAFNQNASLRFRFNFRGAVYNGSYTIHALMNTSVGSLHDPIVQLIGRETARVESSLNQQIENVIGAVDDESRSLAAISDRISPYKTLTITAPEVFALYNDSSGVDPFPTDLSTLNDVSADNPQFVVNSTAAFIAVPAPGNFVLKDLTASTVLALDNSEATVDLGESLAFEGRTYFVYRVTGLTSGNSFEIDKSTQERVVAWQSDLDNLEADIARIDAELEHAALNLPDDVVQVLDNELTVTEESTPTIIPSEYNKGLAGTASQVVFYEPSANTPSGGVLASRPINENTGDQARRKLVYIDAGTTYNNQAYLSAFDGTTGRDLIRYVNGVFNAQVFVPAKSAGTSTETIYPAPSNRVSGEGVWQRVPALTFVNGIPVAEADEIFFTRNVPSQAVTLNIQYRGHANGNVFGAGSATLAGVGGASDVFTTFVLNDGSEQATVEVLYRAAHRDIRVSVTERVNTGLPTINDVEVILSFDETRVIPATPATVREVAIEFEHPGGQVFAIKPSTSGNLIIVGDRTEIDTGYAYTTLFGASEAGHLILGAQTGVFLNYEDFEPITSTVTDLENHASLPQRGLFSTQYTRETLLNIGVTIKPQGINAGDLPIAATGLVSGDLWNDSGTLRIV